MYTQKSFVQKPAEAQKKWYLVDAKDMIVGRLASEIAKVLRGKAKPQFTPYEDAGDFVVVINADKVRFTGNKLTDKNYNWHSGYTGGIKTRTAQEQLQKRPDLVIFEAVKGMLPKSTLGRKQLTKLKVFAGEKHDHEAQKPQPLTFKI
ncbi:MAG: 50S ribosomal protein L13 [Bdellovibrio sp.]